MAQKNNDPTKVMDLHGIRAALSTANNQIKSTVIDGIQSGDIQLFKGVSEELKAIDEDLYADFQTIRPKKYMKIKAAHQSHAQMLSEQHGSGLFGSFPPSERFECVALCMKEGLELVSAPKALKEYKGIVSKCALNGLIVRDISEL
ncbi:hypothetical protein A8B82_13555 [Sulfitobacter sp. EhC04]|uniref:hypothetical protein n=1 Tax=Sulfitobacter sp. EhC04 TaxID=1849168 RepID=UPI0007F46DB1|nr:hypothetical protein [Sulfitobacter sp. EhC04]OAN77221.1 hypothetical protein A8B82_13555 [Sulfitobacter sp. EhC04]